MGPQFNTAVVYFNGISFYNCFALAYVNRFDFVVRASYLFVSGFMRKTNKTFLFVFSFLLNIFIHIVLWPFNLCVAYMQNGELGF